MIERTKLEDGLIALLQSIIDESTAVVEAFPRDPENYTLTHRDAAILVQYVGYEAESKFNSSGQIAKLRVLILSRNLRDHRGIYPLLDEIVEGVNNKRLVYGEDNIGQVKYLYDEFQIEDHGIWQHLIELNVEMY